MFVRPLITIMLVAHCTSCVTKLDYVLKSPTFDATEFGTAQIIVGSLAVSKQVSVQSEKAKDPKGASQINFHPGGDFSLTQLKANAFAFAREIIDEDGGHVPVSIFSLNPPIKEEFLNTISSQMKESGKLTKSSLVNLRSEIFKKHQIKYFAILVIEDDCGFHSQQLEIKDKDPNDPDSTRIEVQTLYSVRRLTTRLVIYNLENGHLSWEGGATDEAHHLNTYNREIRDGFLSDLGDSMADDLIFQKKYPKIASRSEVLKNVFEHFATHLPH
jgi:hypothetical protein